MRKVHVTIECDEKVLGPLIVDLSEKPNARVVSVKVVSELPHHVNGKAAKANGHASGLTGWEVMEKLSKEKPGGVTFNDLKEGFESAGLKATSVNSFLTSMQHKGEIKRIPVKGQRLSHYRINH